MIPSKDHEEDKGVSPLFNFILEVLASTSRQGKKASIVMNLQEKKFLLEPVVV